MRVNTPSVVYSTIGQSSHEADRINYTYGGDKPYEGPDKEKVHVPNPKGGIFPDSSERKQKRLKAFREALDELGGIDAPMRAVVEAGRRIGVADRTATNYRAELRRQQGGGA